MKNRIYIGVTKKLENIENYTPQINFWHASLRFVNRKKCILFMNDLTRYSVFLYGLKKKDLSNLKNIFIDSLIDTI